MTQCCLTQVSRGILLAPVNDFFLPDEHKEFEDSLSAPFPCAEGAFHMGVQCLEQCSHCVTKRQKVNALREHELCLPLKQLGYWVSSEANKWMRFKPLFVRLSATSSQNTLADTHREKWVLQAADHKVGNWLSEA